MEARKHLDRQFQHSPTSSSRKESKTRPNSPNNSDMCFEKYDTMQMGDDRYLVMDLAILFAFAKMCLMTKLACWLTIAHKSRPRDFPIEPCQRICDVSLEPGFVPLTRDSWIGTV
jgi:hypothetical protein